MVFLHFSFLRIEEQSVQQINQNTIIIDQTTMQTDILTGTLITIAFDSRIKLVSIIWLLLYTGNSFELIISDFVALIVRTTELSYLYHIIQFTTGFMIEPFDDSHVSAPIVDSGISKTNGLMIRDSKPFLVD